MDNKQFNSIPEIDFFTDLSGNPTINSPNSEYQICFYQTKDTLMDVEVYRNFLKNAIQRFRRSETYKHYKGFLMENGLDHCQYLGNISGDLDGVSLEMHHSIINIYTVAYIICEHVLATKGKINTFQLAELIRQEHMDHHIPVCFLSLTPHQLYHNDDNFYISPNMVFGDWITFLNKYWYGINSIDVINKIKYYLHRAIDEDGLSTDGNLLELNQRIEDWSNYSCMVNF